MAFSTLNSLRAQLNTELARTDASTTPWGSDTDCNTFLQWAFKRLWPRMGRLVRETFTPTDTTAQYTLTSVEDVSYLDVLDANSLPADRIVSWDLIVDESADPVVRRLVVPLLDTSTTVRITGYARYKVPASGADTCDLPTNLEHVVIAGGRAYAYKRRLNEYVDFKNRQGANPVTAVDEERIQRMFLSAEAEFEQLMKENQRNLVTPKRAIRTIR